MLKLLLRLIGTIQIVLGLAYLFAPDPFLASMGHSIPPADIHYPLAMLASRFLVYGAGFWLAAMAPEKNRLLIRLMGAIQLVDLGAGLYFTLNGTVALGLSAFPMFNAIWIGLVAFFWPLPREAV